MADVTQGVLDVRGLKTRVALAATFLLAAPTVAAMPASAADPGDGDVPTAQEVADARAAVEVKTNDVESVRAALVAAEQRLQTTQIAAAQAAEAFNGARYQARLAGQEARRAQRRTEAAHADAEGQRQAYASVVTSMYQLSPSLSALSGIVQADGLSEVIGSTTALQNAEEAIESRYEAFQAAATLAEVVDAQADEALEIAAAAKGEAEQARDQARDAASAAEQEAGAYAAERDRLIGELAVLEDVNVELARERQEALEQAAAEAAAAAAQAAAEQAAQDAAEQAAQEAAEQAAEEAAEQAAQDEADEQEPEEPEPSDDPDPAPAPEPDPAPTPDPDPPAPSGGAQAAIDFAKAQIGEPYKYGAAGPSSWDCSGLTMMAWKSGGKSLPHYSVAQYQQSTPISIGNLQPGDLLFWGNSNKSSSIYHVALYIGGGQMIHAPRPGRSVEQVSMYYWITPNLFARP